MDAILLLVSVLIFFTSLFTFWRKLKEDYISSQIFGLGFMLLLLMAGSFFCLYYIRFETAKWIVLFIPLTAVFIYSRRNRMRFNEVVNALTLGFLLTNILFYLKKIHDGSAFVYVFPLLFIALLLFFFVFLERNFRKIPWYTSGRVGFSGLVVYSIFFLINAIIAFILPDMVFFTGKINALISFFVAVISLCALYKLSKKIS